MSAGSSPLVLFQDRRGALLAGFDPVDLAVKEDQGCIQRLLAVLQPFDLQLEYFKGPFWGVLTCAIFFVQSQDLPKRIAERLLETDHPGGVHILGLKHLIRIRPALETAVGLQKALGDVKPDRIHG
jgi:hypothetical protein